MNKELILMLVLSFVVGYIVSEVVRKCGCNIVEGITDDQNNGVDQIDGQGGDDRLDPGKNKVSEDTGYDDPPCEFGVNTPRQACTDPAGWQQYKPAGGHKEGACKWRCGGDDALGVCHTNPDHPKQPACCPYGDVQQDCDWFYNMINNLNNCD